MPTLHPHPDDHDHAALQPCLHPVSRRFAWFARDDTQPAGNVLVVACCDCGLVLQGAVDTLTASSVPTGIDEVHPCD